MGSQGTLRYRRTSWYYTRLEENFGDFYRKIPHFSDPEENICFSLWKQSHSQFAPLALFSTEQTQKSETFSLTDLNLCLEHHTEVVFWGLSVSFPNFHICLESHKPFEWDGGSFLSLEAKFVHQKAYCKTSRIYIFLDLLAICCPSAAAGKTATAIEQIVFPLLLTLLTCFTRGLLQFPISLQLCSNSIAFSAFCFSVQLSPPQVFWGHQTKTLTQKCKCACLLL